MDRRRLLRGCVASLPFVVAECAGDGSTGEDGTPTETPTPSPTPSPTPEPGVPSGDSLVELVGTADQPEVPVEYAAAMTEPLATDEHPERLRVTISNPTDSEVVLGEERAVQGHHVRSDDGALYLLPVGDGTTGNFAEPGCWKLTDPVAVAAYYGTLSIPAGETRVGDSFVYASVDAASECLPAGEHRVTLTGNAAESSDAVLDGEGATSYEWGFTLGVRNG